ncbi:hypothetical protein BDV41DRAFT_589639 [Aspergillus transmontanensis]|uniref:MARVEL domain-containing protein n=1 Tax=Aspergillus transmontanensis TaxID=1034304 RepID=A0A5N6VST9_9EURO|nr:hypothetical protein BDV41DRAFT_589639 [Aspergillus transmontanensis]
MLTRKRQRPRPSAIAFRILLFATLIVIMVYGAVTPHQMYKVTAECVLIGIAGLSMAVQVYITWAIFACCLPYTPWVGIVLDGVCALGWIGAIIVLSYWDRAIVYMPQEGDPKEWFTCAKAHTWDKVLTDDGIGLWINILWCEVEVDGRERLVGNGAARQQLHALIGLASVSLFFTGLILWWTIRRRNDYF